MHVESEAMLSKSYLTDRTQYVVYDSKQSETLPIK